MTVTERLVDDALARWPVPFTVCLAPGAEVALRGLGAVFPPEARVLCFQGDTAPAVTGAAVVILASSDLAGRHRSALLGLVKAAQPGRPVLYGGTRSRETLLDAINVWRVLRAVPDGADPMVLLDAVRKSYEVTCLEHGLQAAATDLQQDTSRLEQALDTLEASQTRLRQAERMATLGRITNQLIPALGTHLAALEEFNAAIKTAGPGDAEVDDLVACAFGGVHAMTAMLDEVRSYAESRHETYRLKLQELDGVVGFAAGFSRFDPLAAFLDVGTELGAGVRVQVDAHRLQQVIVNLLRNAFQATPRRGTVVVRTAAEGRDAIIDVENVGPAIPPEVLARLFQPFVSTKGEEGLGLGLPMCKSTVERHGGTIVHERTPDERTRFRIRLPIAG